MRDVDTDDLLARIDDVLDAGCHTRPYSGMSDHHCCDPHHRDLAERLRRARADLVEWQARARWAETNEAVLADRLEGLRRSGGDATYRAPSP